MKRFAGLIIFFLFSIQACSSHRNKIATGLVDSISCNTLPEQIYAAYLPDSAGEGANYPAVFLFDPAARAKTTVELYKTLANKYHVALFCSYNSKNGPADQNKVSADAMITDATARFPVDESKFIVSGFSGGSRFAYWYALQNRKIKGVVACGAFFPGNSDKLPKPSFNYSGIAGTFDFNFREGLSMQSFMQSQNYPFQFIAFNGSHEWPPKESFERALVYQLARLTNSKTLWFACNSLEQKALGENLDNNDFIGAAWIYQNLLLLPTTNPRIYTDSLKALFSGKEFKSQQKLFSKSLELEDSISAEFMEATQGIVLVTYNQPDKHKSMHWWKQKISTISKMEENSKDIYLRNSAKRIKGQIGVMLWETNRKLMSEKYYDQSLELAEILLLIDPENATYIALIAEVLVAQGKTNEAKIHFQQAKDKGFTMDNAFLGKSLLLKKLEE